MSSEPDKVALRVADVGKTFRVYPSFIHRVARAVTHGRRGRCREVHALRHVGFEVQRGKAMGIIGENGAGKSTLLKIIAGTLHPTTGNVQMRGRIAAMLELGMGFHGQLTGRENIRLNGMLLGLSAAELQDSMDRIIAFSELGGFIDQPLRTYSTGMAMRLAYSVAAASRPDILIIDEALSVGDAYFQQKCYSHLESFLNAGGTVLFVSHDAGAVTRLCDQAVLLDHGTVVTTGRPVDVLDVYNARLAQRAGGTLEETQTQRSGVLTYRGGTRSGQFRAVILDTKLLNEGGHPARTFISGSRATFRLRGAVVYPVGDLTVGMQIRDRLGTAVFGQNSYQLRKTIRGDTPHTFQADFDLVLDLGPGDYTISAALHAAEQHLAGNFDWADRLVSFVIAEDPARRFTGLARLPIDLSLSQDEHLDRAGLQAMFDELFADAPAELSASQRGVAYFLTGVYPPEQAGEMTFRWCGPEAILAVRAGGGTLTIELLHDRQDARHQELTIHADAAGIELGQRSLPFGPSQPLTWDLPEQLTGHVAMLRLRCRPAFRPSSKQKSADSRQLGMKLLRVSTLP